MSEPEIPLISRRRTLTLGAYVGLCAIAGCGGGEEKAPPAPVGSKKETLGGNDETVTRAKTSRR